MSGLRMGKHLLSVIASGGTLGSIKASGVNIFLSHSEVSPHYLVLPSPPRAPVLNKHSSAGAKESSYFPTVEY
jgi:hypothetical protein